MATAPNLMLRNVMLSAAGRRVALLRILQRSLDELGVGGIVIASDITPTSSAMLAAQRRIVVPPVGDPECFATMLRIARDEHLLLIVPTIDTELSFFARHACQFANIGCRVNISSPQTIDIGFDKAATHEFLCRHRIPTVRQWAMADAIQIAQDLPYPLIVKPRRGSASSGVSLAQNVAQLSWRSGDPDLIVQTVAPGREYTVDAFVDGEGTCRCVVPRLRLETRGGEVSKGVTVRNAPVMDAVRRVAEALPGARGVLNVQVFHDETSGQLNVIEINPRFGGGYPLTHHAGAPMTRWLLEEALGSPCSASNDQWKEGVAMLRYDDAVFASAQEAGIPLPGRKG